MDLKQLELDEEEEGVVEWDWLDENSPMLSDQSEAEWVLDRLCESLLRWLKRNCIGGDALSPTDGRRLSPEERIYAGLEPPRSDATLAQSDPAVARSTGAAMLDFFTGRRDGDNAYANQEAIWSNKARTRQQHGRRRSSSSGERKGPFGKFSVHHHHGPKPQVGGSQEGAGTLTLKPRALGISKH